MLTLHKRWPLILLAISPLSAAGCGADIARQHTACGTSQTHGVYGEAYPGQATLALRCIVPGPQEQPSPASGRLLSSSPRA